MLPKSPKPGWPAATGTAPCHRSGSECPDRQSVLRAQALQSVCENVKAMGEPRPPGDDERSILDSHPRGAGPIRGTPAVLLGRSRHGRGFPTHALSIVSVKEVLLEAFGRYEQQRYDGGIAQAVAGLEGDARLEAMLRLIVEFQHSSSLRRIVDVEPEHVVHQMTRVMPIMRERLLAHFPGSDGRCSGTRS